MKRGLIAWALCVLALVFPHTGLVAQNAQPVVAAQTGLRVERLSIKTPAGVRKFQVEIADTPRTREIGMMWRTEVPDGTGMLFNFKRPQRAYFWMENTLVGLDLIFIRSDGTIANIIANATPLSRQALPSNGDILAVLEIGAGQAQKLGIKAGQSVQHPIFDRRK